MPTLQGTFWCFTLNFSGDAPSLSFNERVQYACWQHERVSHDHLQGYIQMKKRSTLKMMKELLPGAHLEVSKGTPEEASDYAMKEETRVAGPWTYGELLKKGSNKRKLLDRYKENPEDMELEDPAKARRCRAKIDKEKFIAEFKVEDDEQEWKKILEKEIEKIASPRSILWVYGPQGGEGKTSKAKELITRGWFYTRGGKKDDVAYSYVEDPTRHVVFDIPRDMQEYCNYSLIEMLKDRIIISNKYEPITNCQVYNIHVIVMANFLPDVTKISEDRIKIIYC
ncbi:viral replication-associated protein [Milk vetch dwarf C1 alphasatellite]|uniref:Para-Rep C1 n=1 Tax=Milk vetch dwarf C1 alphasatellite TaxID=1455651 RepID=REP1_MVDC1|nr:viral replication-associated protein [Milk vetch dwarf C1 alphasatellite]Q9Z0D5.1 RecName: Full=Para-Rep C1; Short=Rep1; AltName: Full=Replication-associated protein of non-essential DNA C1 [Milk vetch dwarf virus (isolate 1)]BAA33980.1 viral replication-associated protein [Milk vetch dwarf C1 alphasatellite]